jgi:hypothetical protein
LPPRFAFEAESDLICQLPNICPEKSNEGVTTAGVPCAPAVEVARRRQDARVTQTCRVVTGDVR